MAPSPGRPPTQLEPDASRAAYLGAEVRRRRQARGWTLKEFAPRIGYSLQHISEVERAKTTPTAPFVEACDRALEARGRLLDLLPADYGMRSFGGAGCAVTIDLIAIRTNNPRRALAPDDGRLSRPLFTLREAAGYLGMPVSTLHAWGRSTDPLITVGPRRGQQATVPFIGFAEAFVLSAFRRAGVPLQRIRPAVEVLRETMGIEHALAAKDLYTDGAEVLFDYAHERGEAELLELTVVRTGQKQFSELVRDHLTRIRYADDGWASMLELPAYRDATVVVDPKRAFGLPLVVHGGARVEDIVDRFVAGDHLADIAYDFAVPEQEVEDVIRVATRAAPAA